MDSPMENTAVTNFRNYLRIRTEQPNCDYTEAVQYIGNLADEIRLPVRIVEVHPNNPVVIVTWEGTNQSLSSIMLNSHMDVGPVYPSKWNYNPFAAVKTKDGDIYGRGAQDMKCVGIQYLEAIRILLSKMVNYPRSIHVTFMPDEDAGGRYGMSLFVKTKTFEQLNVGFCLDEGMASFGEEFIVYNSQKSCWFANVRCQGDAGHGSEIMQNSAATKIVQVTNKFLAHNALEEEKLRTDPNMTLSDITTINMTCLKGGVKPNLIPAEFTAVFDLRIAPMVNLVEFEEQLHRWCKEAGSDVECNFEIQGFNNHITHTDDTDPWWRAFSSACQLTKISLKIITSPTFCDARFLRAIGIPVLGFSPINNTPHLSYRHNEFLNENIFLRGIAIYCNILSALASVPSF